MSIEVAVLYEIHRRIMDDCVNRKWLDKGFNYSTARELCETAFDNDLYNWAIGKGKKNKHQKMDKLLMQSWSSWNDNHGSPKKNWKDVKNKLKKYIKNNTVFGRRGVQKINSLKINRLKSRNRSRSRNRSKSTGKSRSKSRTKSRGKAKSNTPKSWSLGGGKTKRKRINKKSKRRVKRRKSRKKC